MTLLNRPYHASDAKFSLLRLSLFAIFICCSQMALAIDFDLVEVVEDLSVDCVNPCNRFQVDYNAFNLTADEIDPSSGEVIDYVYIIIRDAECNLVGTHIGEFKEGIGSFGFISAIGGDIEELVKLPMRAYFVDIEDVNDNPQDGNIEGFNLIQIIDIQDDGTFNSQTKDIVFTIPYCHKNNFDINIYGLDDEFEFGQSLIQTPDDGYLLVGFTIKDQKKDVIIKKLNREKQEVWSRKYGGEEEEGNEAEFYGLGEMSVMQDTDGMYIIATTTFSRIGDEAIASLDSVGPSPWIFKIDDSGELIWEKRLVNGNASIFNDLVPNPEGGCYITFSSTSPTYKILQDSIHEVNIYGNVDIGIASIEEDGMVSWVYTVGDEFNNLKSSIDIISDSTFVVLYDSDSDLGLHVARLDATGQVMWDRNFGVDSTAVARKIKVLDDGTYLAASYEYGDFEFNARMMKLDDEGLIWDRRYESYLLDYVTDIFLNDNGETILLGNSVVLPLMILLDDTGNLIKKNRPFLDYGTDFGDFIEMEDGYAVIGSIVNNGIIDSLNIFDNIDEDMFLTFLDEDFNFVQNELTGLVGTVKTRIGEAVPNVDVRLSSGEQMMTNSEGEFQFIDIEDFTNLTLNFSKIDELQTGLSSVDLVQILNHIIGILPFDNQLQIASADLNNDGEVSSADLIILRNAILGFITELPNGTPQWRFSENHIPITAIPNSPINIIANKVGDANGDAIN